MRDEMKEGKGKGIEKLRLVLVFRFDGQWKKRGSGLHLMKFFFF